MAAALRNGAPGATRRDVGRVARCIPQELGPEHLGPFIPHGARIDQEKDSRLAQCLKILAECTSIHSCATHLMEHEPWDFMAVYFDAIDHFSHMFMRYHPPQQAWISDDDFDLYQHVISAAYVYHDMMLARLLELAGDEAPSSCCRITGFIPITSAAARCRSNRRVRRSSIGDFGVFAMRGPRIKRDELVHGITLLDVTPTVLTLFDLPVGEDMDGRPLLDAFEERPAIATIPSWDAVAGDERMPSAGSTSDRARRRGRDRAAHCARLPRSTSGQQREGGASQRRGVAVRPRSFVHGCRTARRRGAAAVQAVRAQAAAVPIWHSARRLPACHGRDRRFCRA
jgi:hypothetical protein